MTNLSRNFDIRVKCTLPEKNKIKEKADKLGQSASSFLRMLGLQTKIQVVKDFF